MVRGLPYLDQYQRNTRTLRNHVGDLNGLWQSARKMRPKRPFAFEATPVPVAWLDIDAAELPGLGLVATDPIPYDWPAKVGTSGWTDWAGLTTERGFDASTLGYLNALPAVSFGASSFFFARWPTMDTAGFTIFVVATNDLYHHFSYRTTLPNGSSGRVTVSFTDVSAGLIDQETFSGRAVLPRNVSWQTSPAFTPGSPSMWAVRVNQTEQHLYGDSVELATGANSFTSGNDIGFQWDRVEIASTGSSALMHQWMLFDWMLTDAEFDAVAAMLTAKWSL